MNSVNCWLDAHACLYWYRTVCKALKTSEDTMTLRHVSQETLSEFQRNSLPAKLLLLWLEQSGCYAVSWRERDKGNYLGKCDTHNMQHTYKLPKVCTWCSQKLKCKWKINYLKCLLINTWEYMNMAHWGCLKSHIVCNTRSSKMRLGQSADVKDCLFSNTHLIIQFAIHVTLFCFALNVINVIFHLTMQWCSESESINLAHNRLSFRIGSIHNFYMLYIIYLIQIVPCPDLDLSNHPKALSEGQHCLEFGLDSFLFNHYYLAFVLFFRSCWKYTLLFKHKACAHCNLKMMVGNVIICVFSLHLHCTCCIQKCSTLKSIILKLP